MFERMSERVRRIFTTARKDVTPEPEEEEASFPDDEEFPTNVPWTSRRRLSGGFDFKGNPWIFACVMRIANAAAEVPYYIEGKDKDVGGLLDLIRKPSPRLTYEQLIKRTCIFLLTSGSSYWEKVGKPPGSLSVLRSRLVTVMTDSEGKRITGYRYPNGTDFKPSDIVRMYLFDPDDDWKGLCPYSTAYDEERFYDNAYAWINKVAENAGMGEGFFRPERVIGKEEQERLSTSWKRPLRRSKFPFLPKGLEWLPASNVAREGFLPPLLKASLAAILATMGVPPSEVGLLDYAKYSALDLQTRIFMRDAVFPVLSEIESGVNLFLLPDFKPRSKSLFRFDRLKGMFNDPVALADFLAKAFAMRSVSMERVAELLGINDSSQEEDDDGEKEPPLAG